MLMLSPASRAIAVAVPRQNHPARATAATALMVKRLRLARRVRTKTNMVWRRSMPRLREKRPFWLNLTPKSMLSPRVVAASRAIAAATVPQIHLAHHLQAMEIKKLRLVPSTMMRSTTTRRTLLKSTLRSRPMLSKPSKKRPSSTSPTSCRRSVLRTPKSSWLSSVRASRRSSLA